MFVNRLNNPRHQLGSGKNDEFLIRSRKLFSLWQGSANVMGEDDVDSHTILECALSTAHPIWRDFQPWFYHVTNWYILILSSYRSTVIYHTLIKYQHFSIVSMYV